MTQYLHLIGAEDVRKAGSMISGAADSMRSTASQIEDSLLRHRQFLDEWLFRLQEVLHASTNEPADNSKT